MRIVLESRLVPKVTPDNFTIWVARSDGAVRSYSVWRGARTVQALTELLAKLDACGFPATLEIESASCGPIEMTIPELVDLGIVHEEPPTAKARKLVRSLIKHSRLLCGRRS